MENDRFRLTQAIHKSRHSNLYLEAFRYCQHYNYRLHPKVTIGKMYVICGYCQARKFESESIGMKYFGIEAFSLQYKEI
ncbi:hypothetical protein J437_LFUL014377 [Ladona fulva]|uniref:Uncharacterized protein n=1 Tax=Ladona fulva TaxID=123851 RepID=A0A8K0P911_LADFU|nr:hypothetical protein J437_LFUL014377 [Ladona fulva]